MPAPTHLRPRLRRHPDLGSNRPCFPVFRHLAASYQHGHDDRHILGGVPIQNTQNRDSSALHLKLDKLIRVSESARNRLLDLEDLTKSGRPH